jgi:hypothetical protein
MKLRKSGKGILQMLQEAYGSEVKSRPTVFRWQNHFKGNKKVVDDAQSGTAITVQ